LVGLEVTQMIVKGIFEDEIMKKKRKKLKEIKGEKRKK
jgi:hypothetical protein